MNTENEVKKQVKKLIKQHMNYRNQFELTGLWVGNLGSQYVDIKTGKCLFEDEVKIRIETHLTKTSNKIIALSK